jgi:hypothetical protein
VRRTSTRGASVPFPGCPPSGCDCGFRQPGAPYWEQAAEELPWYEFFRKQWTDVIRPIGEGIGCGSVASWPSRRGKPRVQRACAARVSHGTSSSEGGGS